MQFDAPKLPTRGAANDPKLTGGAALAAKATPGTTAPKVEKKPPASKLPALEKKPTAPALPAGSSKPDPAPPLPPPPPAIEQEPVSSEPELSAPAYSNAPEARTSKTISYDGDWPEGDPATPWHAADWDIMFVLPLPEEAVARAATAAAEEAAEKGTVKDLKKAREKAEKAAELAEQQKAAAEAAAAAPHAGEDGEHAISKSEVTLRKGLLLSDADVAADGCGGKESSTTWLISELRRRVLMSGMQCKVVKLLAKPDDLVEDVGEHEILSKHNKTLVCIGSGKVIDNGAAGPAAAALTKTPPPSPPPSPGSSSRAEAKAEAKAEKAIAAAAAKEVKDAAKAEKAKVAAEQKVLKAEAKEEAKMMVADAKAAAQAAKQNLKNAKMDAKDSVRAVTRGMTQADLSRKRHANDPRANERFPRLELEAEVRKMRLPTVGESVGLPGPRAVFRTAAATSFPPFRSMLRQGLAEAILENPLEPGKGAGLDFDKLLASGRIKEIIYVHDDDEVEELNKKIVYGGAGFCPLRPSTLHSLYSYCGGEVSFYFAWVSAYTRSLHLPSLIGLLLWLADLGYFNAALDDQRNATYIAALEEWRANQPDPASGLSGDMASGEAPGEIIPNPWELYHGTGSALGRFRAVLTALFGLLILIWSSGFDETWKRRQATIAFGWGELGSAKPPPSLNPNFKSAAVKPGFYTDDGLWVELPPPPRKPRGTSAEKEPLVVRSTTTSSLASASGTVASAKQPKDVWFSIAKRARRRMTSFFVLVAMTVLCITSIFFMQLFRSFMQGTEVIIGGSDYSSIIVSIANSTLITTFNMTWRSIAIRLSMWENYRLNERMRENLTYKLFIFQCINCYFMLAYTAFGHPFGVRLFGIDMGKCEVRPPPGEASCADEVRTLLYAVMFSNIITGQATEVGTVLYQVCSKRMCRGRAREAKPKESKKKNKSGRGKKVAPTEDEKEEEEAEGEGGKEGNAPAAEEPKEVAKEEEKKEEAKAEEKPAAAPTAAAPTPAAAKTEDKPAATTPSAAPATTEERKPEAPAPAPPPAAEKPTSPTPSPPPSPPGVAPPNLGEVAKKPPDLAEIAKKKRRKEPLTKEEIAVYEQQRVIVDLIAEFERPLVKSVKQGLGNTFYEYNELALQYGYLVIFSILLPAAPVLALFNNIIEIRTDAFKTIYAQRRTRAEPADDIGPWGPALRSLSFVGLFANLGILAVTTDFFDELASIMPTFNQLGTKLAAILVAEHLLLGLKLFIDWIVPDVPAKIRVKLARDEHNAEQRVAKEMAEAEQKA